MRFTNSLVAAVMIMAVSVSALPSTFEQDDSLVMRDVSMAASPLELRGHGLSNGKHCSKSSQCNSGNCCRGTCKVKKSNGKGCYKNANCKSDYCYHKKCTSSSHPSNGHPSNGGGGGSGGGGSGGSGGNGGNGGVVTVTQTIVSNGATVTRTTTSTATPTPTPSNLVINVGGQLVTLPVNIPTTISVANQILTIPSGLSGVFTAVNGVLNTQVPAIVSQVAGGLNGSPIA